MLETDFCRVEYLTAQDAVLCRWKGFCCGEDYRLPLAYGLELLEKYGATSWITDTTFGFESTPDDTRWLAAEFIPKTVRSSCKNVYFIIRNDSPLKHEIESQAEILKEYFNVKLVGTLNSVGHLQHEGSRK